MEHSLKEHEYEEGEVSDSELPWKGHNIVVELGLTTEGLSIPLLSGPCLVRKGDNNWKRLGSEPQEIKGRQQVYKWRDETYSFLQHPENFLQMVWQNGVHGSTEDTFKELRVDGLARDIKTRKGIVNRLNSYSESTSKAENMQNGGLLRRASSWTANQDFDLCLGRKGGRVVEGQETDFLNFLDKRKNENGNFCNERKERSEWRRFTDDIWRNRLERDCPLKPGFTEMIALRSTIEKIDQEDSEWDDTEMNKADEKDGKCDLQLDLLEGQLHLTDAADRHVSPITGKEEEGELEEGEIQGASACHIHFPSEGNEDRPLDSEKENGKTKERSEKRVFEKSHLRNDLREKSYHEINSHQHTKDSDYRLLKCIELVTNVSVRDAQRSFVGVCGQLHSGLKILREMTKCIDCPSPLMTNLACQAFSGIQAAYAVRNTASGKDQEKNRDFFLRLLGLAYGSCRNLFTSVQVKELENMLQTSGKQTFVSRSEQVQHNYSKDSCLVELDKAEQEPQLGNSIGPPSETSPVQAEHRLSCDSHSIPTGIVQTLQMTMPSCTGAGGWLPLRSRYIQGADAAAMAVSGESRYPSLSLDLVEGHCYPLPVAPRSLALLTANNSNKIKVCESIELHREQKSKIIDNVVLCSSSAALDKQEESMSSVDPLSAVSCYHEKFAGKSLMAYTRLPSPTPEEENEDGEESNDGIEADVPCSLGKQVNVDSDSSFQIIEESQLPRLGQVICDSELISNAILDDNSCNVSVDSLNVSDSKVMWTETKLHQSVNKVTVDEHMTSKDPVLVKGFLKSRDPRRKLVNASLNSEVHWKAPVTTENNTHVVEESSKKHKADDNLGVKEPKRLHASTEEGPLKPKDGGSGEDIVASGPIERLKDNEVDNLALCMEFPSSSNITMKREIGSSVMEEEGCLKFISEDLSSDSGHVKRQKIEAVQQEIDNVSVTEKSLTMKEESMSMLCQEVNKFLQPSTTSSSKPKVSSDTAGRDMMKLRMKARDPRRALLGTMFDKSEPLSFNSSKEAGIALAAAPLIMKDMDGSGAGGLFSVFAQEPSEKMREKTSNDQGSTLIQQVVPPASAISKELSGKVDPSSSTIKCGVGDLACNAMTDALPTVPKKKETNEDTGLHPVEHEPCNHWEGMEHLLDGLDEKQCHALRQERARRIEEQNRMLRAKKLCLVLDLDHTLLNSAKFTEIEAEWENRLRSNEAAERARIIRENAGKRELYRFSHMGMWTKLRPGIWNFLARASQLFELHVYTMGNKVYAMEMAKLLDPTGTLFAERVISKGDDGDLVDGDERLPKSKDLDGVLGMESAVVIIDDSVRVWPHHRHNLIVVERYMYFPCSRRQFGVPGPSLLEVGHDEREGDGMLASALAVIEKIHYSFFSHQPLHKVDVRDILATEQRKVLAGCKILFSRVFPQGESQPQLHPLWKIAKQFGAVCTTTMDDGITHVVAISLGTDKVNWAMATGKFVVRPAWLEASAILYRRVNEWGYPVPP